MLRPLAYRLGRKCYAWARGDGSNDPKRNGEYWLVEEVVKRSGDGSVFLDVGANRGDWTAHLLAAARYSGKRIHVHAFEPCTGTRNDLEERYRGAEEVTVHGSALSDRSGTSTFYSKRAGAGTNSLSPISGEIQESVTLSTVDEFRHSLRINKIAIAKVDTEGFDALVLRGALKSLQEGSVDLVQFEYNWRWLMNRESLWNVFAFIEPLPYRLGKLCNGRILLFSEWHFELDRYIENNYVLVRQGSGFEALGREAYYDGSNVLRY